MIDPNGKKDLFSQIMAQKDESFVLMAQENASAGEAEDLYQDIACELLKSQDRFEGRSAPGTWAYKIAMNTAISYRYDTSRRQAALRAYERCAPLEQRGGRCQVEMLQEFMESLPDKKRRILSLLLREMSYQEIAAAAGISEPVLRVEISRIRKLFEQRYL